MELQALFWYIKHRLEEAKSEALCAVDVFEKLGAADGVKRIKEFLQLIDMSSKKLLTPNESDDNGEFLETVLLVVIINSLRLDRATELSWILQMLPSASHQTPRAVEL